MNAMLKNAGSPSSDWSLEDLAAYFQARQEGLAALAKKSAVEVFKAGHALSVVKSKVPGEYLNWLKKHHIKVTTAWEALTLFEKAEGLHPDAGEEALRCRQGKAEEGAESSPAAEGAGNRFIGAGEDRRQVASSSFA